MRVGLATRRSPLSMGFVSGAVKSLERGLVPRERLIRLAEAADLDEARRVLAETPYGDWMKTAVSVSDFEVGLNRSLDRLYRGMEAAFAPRTLVSYWRCQYDFHNLRVALKGRLLGVDEISGLSGLGEYAPEHMLAAVMDDNWHLVSANLSETGKRAKDAWAEGPRAFEAAVDRGFFGARLELARLLRDPFLRHFSRSQIDMANLRVLIRGQARGRTALELEPYQMVGGHVSLAGLGDLMGEEYKLPVGPERFYLERLAGVMARVSEGGDIDQVIENVLLDEVEATAGVPVGVAVPAGYVARVEIEVRLVRLALIGIVTGVSGDQLVDRVRPVHV